PTDHQAQPEADSSRWAEFWQETAALLRRLLIQLQRRPVTLVAGTIQPLMWLVLFGALFQNVPQGLFGEQVGYGQFLGAGTIAFAAFSGALNAGLPVMFDREFGFLNRLLVAPLVSRFSIITASALYIGLLALIQTVAIVIAAAVLGAGLPGLGGLLVVGAIVLLLVAGVTSLSLGLAFALPGHVELIAAIFITNLPLLFASTALAPLSFMPSWLQWIAVLNPLSYAIEPIRYLYLHPDWTLGSVVMQAPFGSVSFGMALGILVIFDVIAIGAVRPLLQRRMA
ncbi:MAG TPA: ABC transporter permease, partial [Coleofasciculaceae cyanobacterium]